MIHTIGVIGLGSIGSRHAKNLIKLGHAVVVQDVSDYAVSDLLGIGARTSGTVDAFVVAAPTEHHLPIFHQLVANSSSSGVPIFMEKPISHRYDSNLAKVAMVGYNLRFHDCVRWTKRWLDDGEIGEPQWAHFTCAQYNDKPAYLRDGVILNWSHEIDLALYLLGDASWVTSDTRFTDGKDDMTDICLRHENKITRTVIHLDYVTKPELRGYVIVGFKGQIQVNLVTREATLYGPDDKIKACAKNGDSFDDDYVNEMAAFIDRIEGRHTIGATGADGLRALNICLQVRKQAGL